MNINIFFILSIFDDPIMGRQLKLALCIVIIISILLGVYYIRHKIIVFCYRREQKRKGIKDDEIDTD